MRKKKILSIVAALCITIAMLSGCGNSENTETGAQTENAETESTNLENVTASEEEAVDNNSGEQVTAGKDEAEERVIASSVAVVEILDALGVSMVGVPTSSYDLPASAADAERIGNPMSPDMEIIASLEPDVIVSVGSLSSELQQQFETIGAETEFVDLSGYDGLKEAIVSLGERFGAADKAAEIVAELESKEEEVNERISADSENEGPSVLVVFGANSSFMVASEDTYVGDLVRRVGGVNIIEDAPSAFSPVDMEYLADKNPDYILFMAHANPEESLAAFKTEFETNEAWQNFDAVVNDKVYALDTGYFGMSANLLAADAMEKLADIFYEEN